MSSWSGHSSVMVWHHHGWSNRQEYIGKGWLVRARRVVAPEVRSGVFVVFCVGFGICGSTIGFVG